MMQTHRIIILLFGAMLASSFHAVNMGRAEAPEVPQTEALEGELLSLKQQWEENHQDHLQEQNTIHLSAEETRAKLCALGKEEHCPPKVATGVDIKKLAYAVAIAETENCTTGVGRSKNNCHGITRCTATGCTFRTYASPAESYADFERIWLRAYGDRFPTREDAKRYVDSEAVDWYRTVTKIYYGKEGK